MKIRPIKSWENAEENIVYFNFTKLANEIIDNRDLFYYLVLDDDGDVYHYYSSTRDVVKRRDGKDIHQVALPSFQYQKIRSKERAKIVAELSEQIREMAWELYDKIEESYWDDYNE